MKTTPFRRKFRFRLRLFVEEEYRPLRAVRPALWAFLALCLAGQGAFNATFLPPPTARAEELSAPPGAGVFRLAALGDPAALSRVVSLTLQAFDNQPGISLRFHQLDYARVAAWLSVSEALDPRSEYPHFAAARTYGGVRDPGRKRLMIEWTRSQFVKDPSRRWEWLAHAASDARHGMLKDPALSLELARLLREATRPGEIPGWARQMEAFLLKSDDEYEAAADLMLSLLEAGEVEDVHEFRLLHDRLSAMLGEMVKRGEIRSRGELRRRVEKLEELTRRYGERFPDIFGKGTGEEAEAGGDGTGN